jgi:hypothetical protein
MYMSTSYGPQLHLDVPEIKRPVLQLNVSGQLEPGLLLAVSTPPSLDLYLSGPQEPELHLDVSG